MKTFIISFLLFISLTSIGQSIKISGLPVNTSPADSAVLPGVIGGVTKGIYGKDLSETQITTIAKLRALTTPTQTIRYYTTDKGQEGFWYYDNADITSSDNTGTILVSGSLRFKRIIANDSKINATWFGATTTSNDNSAAVQAAVNYLGARASLGAEGGILHFPYGVFTFSAGVNIPYDNVIIEGEGRGTFLKASSSVTLPILFNWSIAGVRGEGGGIRDISIYGNNGHLQWAVFLDSWRYWKAENVQVRDETKGFIDAVGNQTTYGEHIIISNCDGIGASNGSPTTDFFIRFRAGTAGTWTECTIRDILAIGVDSVGVVLDGCQRFTVSQLAVANNTTNCYQALLITNTRVMSQTADAGLHSVQGVYFEMQSGAGTFTANQAVLIESPVGQTGFNRHNVIRDIAVNDRSKVAAIRFKNSSATPFLTADNTMYSYRAAVDSPSTIYIDSNVVDTHIYTNGSTNKASKIVDNGLRTVINYTQQGTWGTGNAPPTNVVDVGTIARNLSDGTIYWIDQKGNPRRIDNQLPGTYSPSAFKEVSTYATMVALGTPTVLMVFKVAADENKGISNSIYMWYPNGKRIWVAGTDDN